MIIQTIGSHSSLQILHGAKKEGFKTAVVTDYVRKKFYENFYFIDSILGYENLDKAITQINSLGRDSILVPHGSLVEYLGKERVSKIDVKIFWKQKYI